jgi:thioredoxin 1
MLAQNELIAVIYHSTVYCPVCESLTDVFRGLSQEPEYSAIKFITIDTTNNPIADQYIRKRMQPFLATFRRSILIECNSVQTEEGLTRILTNLLDYNPGI